MKKKNTSMSIKNTTKHMKRMYKLPNSYFLQLNMLNLKEWLHGRRFRGGKRGATTPGENGGEPTGRSEGEEGEIYCPRFVRSVSSFGTQDEDPTDHERKHSGRQHSAQA
jgi:hypothetical protein